MEAKHVHRRYGKDCQSGFRRFSLLAPSARENATLSVGIEALPGVQAAVGRGRQDTAGLCATGIRRLPEVREARIRFSRVRCETCHEERLVAFSCKRRGFCPSCGARRMAESSALLVDEVFPHQPVRQWVLSFPFQSGCGPYVFSSPVVR